MTPRLPTAMVDQLQAAGTDAATRLRAAGSQPGVRYGQYPVHPWLADQLTLISLALRAGTGRLCPHIGPAPRVVHAYAWAPGLLVCSACTALATPDAGEDTTCDRCHQPAERLWSAIVAAGPILFGYGLCRPCHTTINSPTAAPRKDARQ
jgi:hypothetical protein